MPRGRPRKAISNELVSREQNVKKLGKKLINSFPLVKYYKYSPSTMNYKETSYDRYIKGFSGSEQNERSDKIKILLDLCKTINFLTHFIEIITNKIVVVVDEKNFEIEIMPYMLKIKNSASDINIGITDIVGIRSSQKLSAPHLFSTNEQGLFERKK